MKNLLLRNKGLAAGIAILLIAMLAWLAIGFFGIHKAFVDDVVNEDGPVFDVVASAETAATAIPLTAPVELPTEAEAASIPEAAAPTAAATEPAATERAEATTSDPADQAANSEAAAADAVAAAPAPVTATPVPASPAAPTPVASAATPVPASPAAPTPEPTPVPETAPGEVVTQLRGNFQSRNDYSVSGTASVLSNGTEQRFLRFEDFASDNGPDLKVYLRAANGDFVSLGSLSGNIGNQNYEIPVGVDLNVFSSVEIWCERFNSGFGAAQLNAA